MIFQSREKETQSSFPGDFAVTVFAGFGLDSLALVRLFTFPPLPSLALSARTDSVAMSKRKRGGKPSPAVDDLVELARTAKPPPSPGKKILRKTAKSFSGVDSAESDSDDGGSDPEFESLKPGKRIKRVARAARAATAKMSAHNAKDAGGRTKNSVRSGAGARGRTRSEEGDVGKRKGANGRLEVGGARKAVTVKLKAPGKAMAASGGKAGVKAGSKAGAAARRNGETVLNLGGARAAKELKAASESAKKVCRKPEESESDDDDQDDEALMANLLKSSDKKKTSFLNVETGSVNMDGDHDDDISVPCNTPERMKEVRTEDCVAGRRSTPRRNTRKQIINYVDRGSDDDDGDSDADDSNDRFGNMPLGDKARKEEAVPLDSSPLPSHIPSSQGGGSQVLTLNVKVIKKRRTAKQRDERQLAYEAIKQKRLDDDEQAWIRQSFCDLYPTPPSNMLAAGRYELQHGKEMTKEMTQMLWDRELKPWSDKWWDYYGKFTQAIRDHKLTKPLTKSTRTNEAECKRLAMKFHIEFGDARENRTPQQDLEAFRVIERDAAVERRAALAASEAATRREKSAKVVTAVPALDTVTLPAKFEQAPGQSVPSTTGSTIVSAAEIAALAETDIDVVIAPNVSRPADSVEVLTTSSRAVVLDSEEVLTSSSIAVSRQAEPGDDSREADTPHDQGLSDQDNAALPSQDVVNLISQEPSVP